MQAGLRNVGHAPFLARCQAYASSSRPPLATRRNASYLNPIDWVKEKLVPAIREKESKEEVEARRQQAAEDGTRNLFETVPSQKAKDRRNSATSSATGRHVARKATKPRPALHKYSTANFKISHRKLNMLGRQVAGKPIDYAILQMQFSEKRASSRIMNMLATARDHATRYKRLKEEYLYVAEAWVTKGPKGAKRLEPRGRGHFGVQTHPNSRLHVVLKQGIPLALKESTRRRKQVKKIISASIVREDKPIRNPGPMWGW